MLCHVTSDVSCGTHSVRNQASRRFCPQSNPEKQKRKGENNCSDRFQLCVRRPWSVHALGRQSRAHQGHSIRYNYNYALRLYCTKISMLISGLIPCALRMLLPAETIVGAAIGTHAAGRQGASLGVGALKSHSLHSRRDRRCTPALSTQLLWGEDTERRLVGTLPTRPDTHS